MELSALNAPDHLIYEFIQKKIDICCIVSKIAWLLTEYCVGMVF